MRQTVDTLKRWCTVPVRDRRNEVRILVWTVLWMGSFLAVVLAMDGGRLGSGWALAVAAGVTAALGLGTLLAYRRFLQETDELRRKIELDALAFGFGAGVIGALSGAILAQGGVLPADEMLAYVVALMGLVYTVGAVLGFRRYS